jgi:hypothetical protein
MKQFRRRSARAILVPFALFALVIASSLPASADYSSDGATYTAPTYSKVVIGPLSLKW